MHNSLVSSLYIEADGILQKIKELDPDVCVLQEVDIGCQRSQNRNHMEELCRKLKMKGAFVCEFWELDDPLRKPRDAVSKRERGDYGMG
jgi:hypothetical protein